MKNGRIVDEVGNNYGRLTVVSRAKSTSNHAKWNCSCSCGVMTIVSGTHLRSKHTTSCGCALKEARIKHGKHGTPTYNTWASMIARCYNPKCKNYTHYGARGILVCDRWRWSPDSFIDDMGESKPGFSLERIDVNDGYYPENCKWATAKDQARNKRNNRLISFNGITQCESAWAESLGIKRSTLHNRLTVRGWGIEKSLTIPVRFKSKNNGESNVKLI